jgi:hypothetical protein
VLFLRKNPEAQSWLEKLANKQNKAKALTILAHKLGRAVFFIMKRKTPFDQQRILNVQEGTGLAWRLTGIVMHKPD